MAESPPMSSRAALERLWTSLSLPSSALSSVSLLGPSCALPSSFALTSLSTSTIASSALISSLILSSRTGLPPGSSSRKVTIDTRDAAAEFRSEQLASTTTLEGISTKGKVWDDLAGVYESGDGGLIRPHTNWRHHKMGILKMLDLEEGASKEQVKEAFLNVEDSEKFVEEAMEKGLVVTRMRTFEEWDVHPQGLSSSSSFASKGPISLERLTSRPPRPFLPSGPNRKRPLSGVRVLDLTRVLAGPIAGRTLAAYGADVILVTAPHLPSLPNIDFDTSRGKRTLSLDLRPLSSSSTADRNTFHRLLSTADVLLQSYSPGALSRLGYSLEDILKINPDIVFATLSAWGAEEDGPWKSRKGFDSLVQHGTGFGDSEGRAFNAWKGEKGERTKAFPCQALDHASGYLLAFGIQAALYKRSLTGGGGAYKVTNSLLGTSLFLRSLGREESSSFATELETVEQLRERGWMEELEGWSGQVEGVRHAAEIEGAEVGARRSPRGLGEESVEEVEWL